MDLNDESEKDQPIQPSMQTQEMFHAVTTNIKFLDDNGSEIEQHVDKLTDRNPHHRVE